MARPWILWGPALDTEVKVGVRAGIFILTRILRLEGCEDGINRGEGMGDLERYIYIHGTDNEKSVGAPTVRAAAPAGGTRTSWNCSTIFRRVCLSLSIDGVSCRGLHFRASSARA